jgi:hypothetical protein
LIHSFMQNTVSFFFKKKEIVFKLFILKELEKDKKLLQTAC